MSKPPNKVEQAMYLADVRLYVMELTQAEEEGDGHWINDNQFLETILRYQVRGYAYDTVAGALVDAYRAVMKEAVGK